MRRTGKGKDCILVLGGDFAGVAPHYVHTSPGPAVEWQVYRTVCDVQDGKVLLEMQLA